MRSLRFVGAGGCLLGLTLGCVVLLSGCGSGTSGGTGGAATTPQAQEQRKNMEGFYQTKVQKAGPRR